MASAKKWRKIKQGRKGAGRPGKVPLAAHRAFAPLLGLWGALLGGSVVLVLPTSLIDASLRGTLIGTWGASTQSALAAILAFVLGMVLFAFSSVRHTAARRQFTRHAVAQFAARKVTPINPARDLGSKRLDDPVDTMPFSTPAWRDADVAVAAAVPAPAPAPALAPALALAPEPIELDLAAFAELPGRNAVWVEEPPLSPQPAAAARPDPVADARSSRLRAVASLPPAAGTAAMSRLRAVPASELSLAEMVERFAAALHEHRETPPLRNLDPADLAAREAALAEALKALAALSGANSTAAPVSSGEEPLRDAIAQLRPRRGAA
jgi:hypothetical protein